MPRIKIEKKKKEKKIIMMDVVFFCGDTAYREMRYRVKNHRESRCVCCTLSGAAGVHHRRPV